MSTRRLTSGSEDFDVFAHQQADSLGRLAYRLTGQRESARDLVQDVLLTCFRQWAKVAAADNQKAYVRRILVNQHLTSMRRGGVPQVVALESLDSLQPVEGARAGDAVLDDRDAVWRALSNLSDRQRTVLVLRYYEDLDDEAIAAVVGCRRSTVRSLAARGLSALGANPHLTHAVSGTAEGSS